VIDDPVDPRTHPQIDQADSNHLPDLIEAAVDYEEEDHDQDIPLQAQEGVHGVGSNLSVGIFDAVLEVLN
jgi:hypothetical protein